MITLSNPKHVLLLLVILGVVAFVGWQMFLSLTPPRHADHDHAMASLDAGGFMRVQKFGGGQRNLVGKPGRVLVLHFFDPLAPSSAEQTGAATVAQSLADDPTVEFLFIARADSWDGLEAWAGRAGIKTENLYLDREAKTATRFGVRRWPETLIYSPSGKLAHQAMGSVNWTSPVILGHIRRAKTVVSEID